MICLAIHCGHNATAALSINGEIIAIISEERITRIKNYTGFPVESLRFIKSKYLNNSLKKISKFIFIDESGHALNYLKKNKFKKNEKFSPNEPVANNKKNRNIILYNLIPKFIFNSATKLKRLAKNIISKNTINQKKIITQIFKLYPDLSFDLNKINFYNHHEMHALSFRYFFDNFEKDSLIFTMDGEGDNLSSAVYTFNSNNNLKKISENSNDCSIGYFYSQATEHLGLKPFEHEFKVMGMAPYGKIEDVERICSNLKHLIWLDDKGNFNSYVVCSLFKYEFSRIFQNEKFQNICGAIQKMTENLILEWIGFWVKKMSLKNIIVSGGVFMNIKVCKEVLDQDIIDSLFVVPSSTDESLIFGALWKANNQKSEILKNHAKISNLYYGQNFEDKVTDFIKDNDIENNYRVKKFDNYKELNSYVAQLLCDNEIIGRCSGREEWGARALGNRSIICNPSKLENIRLINSTIKERDYWMPFSPTILEPDEKKYLHNKKKFKADFMTCLFDSTEIARKELICAIHPVDFTLRPQILKEDINPIYYDLINQFKGKTGIGGVLNTSFNLHGYPNVSTQEDAFKTFEKSNLKFLVIENYLIEKLDFGATTH